MDSALIGGVVIAGFMLVGERASITSMPREIAAIKKLSLAAHYHHGLERADEYGYGLTLADTRSRPAASLSRRRVPR